ncbi:G-protein alpha subunit [Moesziomyces antarcticus T-34]|uniref:G-protein alpha subunit n=1 Tax=Pseudozyma antarctica (strain T-34) TaxID=1151754 RepID=M9M4I6_PSEA3|nr:G-protein alpha subunit [Moesziomyces antarcticus T-34]
MSPTVSSRDIRRMQSGNMTPNDRDPLSLALRPPSNETAAQRQVRLHQEKQAKLRSDEIDKLLKRTEASTSNSASLEAKKGRVYKMVLLGQAGAGKTTVLKQMRLLYDAEAHERERKGWTSIVVLNLTASVRVLLQTLERYHQGRAERKSLELARLESPASPVSPHSTHNAVSPSSATESVIETASARALGPSNTAWERHLPKIVQLESKLRGQLGAFGEEAPVNDPESRMMTTRRTKMGDKSLLLLRPGWQERLFTYARRSLSLGAGGRNYMQEQTHRDEEAGGDDESDALVLLRSIQAEVTALWDDDVRCRALRKRGVFLDGQSEAATSYFLEAYARIVAPGYSPSDEDILHSRVRTLGVTEDVFRIDRSLTYRVFDVGGSRSQRAAWVPFLDDAQSIIFLAPLSAFDQPLVEDPSTNRLADTFALFTQVVSHPLLRRASVILFLNKIDLLEKKLRQGRSLASFWPEYGGDNDFEAVWRWFRAKFRDELRRAEDDGGGARRRLYVHTTVATSTRQIKAILMSVKDSILRDNLQAAGLV